MGARLAGNPGHWGIMWVVTPDQIDRVAGQILADAAKATAINRPRRPVVLIDGGSGSGKSTLADALVPILQASSGQPWQLVHDDFYPGWAGLSAAWTLIPDHILARHDPGYTRWDWSANAPGTRRELDPDEPLLLECCGALTPATAAMATTRIWCHLDAETRKQRALGRDGEVFARHWAMWAVQEELHWLRHHPRRLADIVIDERTSEPPVTPPQE